MRLVNIQYRYLLIRSSCYVYLLVFATFQLGDQTVWNLMLISGGHDSKCISSQKRVFDMNGTDIINVVLLFLIRFICLCVVVRIEKHVKHFVPSSSCVCWMSCIRFIHPACWCTAKTGFLHGKMFHLFKILFIN